MKVLVLGATGMLGHVVSRVLAADPELEVFATSRRQYVGIDEIIGIPPERIIHGVSHEPESIEQAVYASQPAVLINCIGIVKQLDSARDSVAMIAVNSLLPHRLARAAEAVGSRLIQISTDCVFSGQSGSYTEDDIPDARDLYGRSKLLGEVIGSPHLTIRTSIIGPELDSSHGLVEWFLSQPGPSVKGFTNAAFSGVSTLVLARLIRELILDSAELEGLFHVAGQSITKFDLLGLLSRAFQHSVSIVPVDEPRIDRSLDGSRFRAATGFVSPSWPEMVEEMAANWTGRRLTMAHA